uniref:CCHC-type domain-containing protein n=1 Tax=Tanacetum cinerariifolium TaxID=118510 RepID=A0A6L2L1I4_TANCI|nr:hypothetical protein [Tanacetum cinerariifolium]
MQMVGGNGGNQFRQYAGQNAGNLTGYNDVQNIRNQNGNGNLVAARAEGNAAGHNGNQIRCYNCRGVGHYARNCTVRPRRRDAAYLQTQLLIAQKEEAGIQLQAKEYDLIAAVADLDEIEEVNANCILMANLQQASTSGTQTDRAPIYDSDGAAEVHNYKNCDNNEIFNMFTQEEHYTDLLEPIPESHQVTQNDNDVISEATSVEQGRETVEQHSVNFEETHALYDLLYQNSAIEVEKVNSVNLKLKETNADLTTKLARCKNQEKCFEISQEKYDKLERYLNKQLSKEKSTASFLLEENKKLKSDFKTREDKLLDKKFNLRKGASQIVKDENFPIVNQVDARMQNFEIQFLKEAAKFVGDFKSLANELDESLAKHKELELETERLSKAVVNQDIMNIMQKNMLLIHQISKLSLNDKAYKDMQQRIERLQAQLGDLKGKSKYTSCVSDTRNPLSQKLESFDPQLQVEHFNPLGDNTGVLEYDVLDDSTCLMLLEYEKSNSLSKGAKGSKSNLNMPETIV